MLGAPMLKDGVPVGAIVVGLAEPGPTPQRQIDLLKTFADQAVIAIENVRLFNETRRRWSGRPRPRMCCKVISKSLTDAQPVFEAHHPELSAAAVRRRRWPRNHVCGLTRRCRLGRLCRPARRGHSGHVPRSHRIRCRAPACAIVERRVIARSGCARGCDDRPACGREDVRNYAAARSARLLAPLICARSGPSAPSWWPDRSGSVLGPGDRTAQDLRRPGRHRDRERADVQRDQGGAGAADRDGQCAQGDQPLDLRPGRGARNADQHRRSAVSRVVGRDLQNRRRRLPSRRAVRRHAGPDRTPGGPPAVAERSGFADVAGRHRQASRAGRGCADRPRVRAQGCPAGRGLPHAARGSDHARRRSDRRADAGPDLRTGLQREGNRSRHVICRPGRDRDGERAAVQRDQGGAGAADRDRRSAAGHQQLDL